MNDLELLKFLIMESKYPYFSDDDLQKYLDINNGNVYLTASQLCLMKMDNEKSITVGPITIQNPDASYWQNLSLQYADKAATDDDSNGGTGGYYRNYMNRADGQ